MKIEDIEKEFDEKYEIKLFKSLRDEQKQFYRQKISELVRECVGEKRIVPDPVIQRDWMVSDEAYEAFQDRLKSYNQAKSEILAAFKEAGVEI